MSGVYKSITYIYTGFTEMYFMQQRQCQEKEQRRETESSSFDYTCTCTDVQKIYTHVPPQSFSQPGKKKQLKLCKSLEAAKQLIQSTIVSFFNSGK
jgi:hypothetical protein